MDKYEYKVRSEEIIKLMENEKYADAVLIADTIDWNKVRSVIMLERIGELYRLNRRYEESREVYFVAYERNPGNRKLVYELCEVSLEMEDILQAMQFYNEYVKLAPRDIGVYTLRYRIFEAQNVSLEERIELLEELKKKDYLEEWAYELAYLYHRVGLSAKCVEECDELILWFGEGPYVVKALELKKLHEPLTPEQQAKYDARNQVKIDEEGRAAAKEDLMDEEDFRVKTIDMGKYNTMNLQAELAENLREIMSEDSTFENDEKDIRFPDTGEFVHAKNQNTNEADQSGVAMVVPPVEMSQKAVQDTTKDLSGSMNSERDRADWEKEESAKQEHGFLTDTSTISFAGFQKEQEVFFEDKTGDLNFSIPIPQNTPVINPELNEWKKDFASKYQGAGSVPAVSEQVQPVTDPAVERSLSREAAVANAKAMFSQEYDGQMSLVVPENDIVEKQITGQMNLQDVILEWENLKKRNEEKQKESVHQRILEQTGPLFTEFDESIHSGLLSDLEYMEKEDPQVNSDDIKITNLEEEAEEQTETVEVPVTNVSEELAKLEGTPLFGSKEKALSATAESAIISEVVAKEITNLERDERSIWDELREVSSQKEVANDAESVSDDSADDTEKTKSESEVESEPGLTSESANQNNENLFGEVLKEDSVKDMQDLPEVETSIYQDLQESTDSAGAESDYGSQETGNGEYSHLPESEGDGSSDSAMARADNGNEVPESEENSGNDPTESEDDSCNEISETENDTQTESVKSRELTKEEQSLFSDFTYSSKMTNQLLDTLEKMTLASYSGNVLITGEPGWGAAKLAKNLVKEVQMTDDNFSGKVAKISGETLNHKDIAATFSKLANGALIVESASELNEDTLKTVSKTLNQENTGILVLMTDTRKGMEQVLAKCPYLPDFFNARIDIAAMNNDVLVKYGREYALEEEYAIDELGTLALYSRIADMQTGTHSVTTSEVKGIVEEAIRYSKKPRISTFGRILVAKRYDSEDRVILGEKDFVH